MDVGKPIRTHEVEPVRDPVPRTDPRPVPTTRPGEKRAPSEAPAK